VRRRRAERLPFARVLRSLAPLLAVAAVAVGCSSTIEKPSTVPQTSAPGASRETRAPTTTSTTAPPAAAFTGSVEELRTRLTARGICTELAEFTPLLPVTVTGLQNCDDGYLLITLPSEAERDAVMLYVANSPCTDTTYLAVADTWIVLPTPATEAIAAEVADILGGEVRAVPCRRD